MLSQDFMQLKDNLLKKILVSIFSTQIIKSKWMD